MKEIGKISRIFRYPVKSMAGVSLDRATLGWHGLEGDRRFAFAQKADQGGFPWLTASRLPELLLYKPYSHGNGDSILPTRVLTPGGKDCELLGEELREEVSRKHGAEVQMMRMKHGIFDDAPFSIIATSTILAVAREAGRPLDVRRFRPNVLIETTKGEPFEEDNWLAKSLSFGDDLDSPSVSITIRDKRCVMINLDPDSAALDHAVMKAAVRLNANNAGVYGTVTAIGDLVVGQKVYLRER